MLAPTLPRALDAGLLTRIGQALLWLLPVLFVIGRSAADVALVLIALLFLARSGAEGEWRWLRTRWVQVGLGLWLYLVLVSPLADDAAAALSRALPFGRFVLFAAALQHWLLPDRGARQTLLAVLGAVVAFVVLDSLLQFATGADLFGRPYAELRLTGPFKGNVAGAFLVAVAFPLIGAAFGRAHASRRRWAMPLAIALTLIIGLTIALTGERTALVMFGFGLFLLFVLLAAARRALLATGLASALAIALAVALSPGLQTRLLDHTALDLHNFWERRVGELYLRGLEVWHNAPVLGVGLKNFRDHCRNLDFEPTGAVEDRCYTHPHHLYNEWLAETGLIGFGGFLALIVLWGRALVAGAAGRTDDHALAVGAGIAVAIFLWPVRPSMSFFSNWNAILFWLMLGLALAVCAPDPDRRRLGPR